VGRKQLPKRVADDEATGLHGGAGQREALAPVESVVNINEIPRSIYEVEGAREVAIESRSF
jgi:hypothetical protein